MVIHYVFVLEADEFSPQIRMFDTYGTYIRTITLEKIATAITVDRTNTKIWVAFRDHTIVRYVIDSSIAELSFGSEGTAHGQFNDIDGLCVDADNNLYVADTNNYRIQKFDSDGNFLESFGTFGTLDGQFNDPKSIAVFGNNLYIADNLNYRVQKFLASNPPSVPTAVKPDNMTNDEWDASAKTLTAIRNPINTLMPTLRWAFVDTDVNDYQSAYQLQISKEPTFETLLYDSYVVEENSVENIGTHAVPDGYLVDEGLYYYKVRLRDSFGLWSQYSVGSFRIDLVAPINPYMTIVESPQTNVTTVHLNLRCDGDVNEMIVADNAAFENSSWGPYGVTAAWTFTDISGEVEKIKVLYVKFRDTAWNETSVVSGTVTIDTKRPTGVGVTLRVPNVAQYYDVDREVYREEEFVAFNSTNNYRAVEYVYGENIIENSVNASADTIYYLMNVDVRKKTGEQVDREGNAGSESDFNAGTVDFIIQGVISTPVTFIIDPQTGSLIFNRTFTDEEKSNGIRVTYRMGKLTYLLARPFVRRNPEGVNEGSTDEEIYDYLGENPRPQDITVVGVENLSVIDVRTGDNALNNSPETKGTIVFNRPVTIREVGARVPLLQGVYGQSYLTVEDIFGFFVGDGITVGNNSFVYVVRNIDVVNNILYIDKPLLESYPVGSTIVKTVKQLKVIYYYGYKEFAVNNTTIDFSLQADGATSVYVDGDVTTEAGRTREWIPYTASLPVTLLPLSGDEVSLSWKKFGRRDVYFNFRDAAGNETGAVSIPGGVWLDLRLTEYPPSPRHPVVIEEAPKTNTQLVHLRFDLPHPLGVQIMAQGDDVIQEEGVTWEWIDYPVGDRLRILLTDTDGPKTVEVYFRTAAHNVSGPIYLPITLDTTVLVGAGRTYFWRVSLFT